MVRIATGVAGLDLTILGLASPLHELREPIVSDCSLLYFTPYSTRQYLILILRTFHSVYSVFCICISNDKMPHSSPHPQFIKSPSKTRWFSFMRTTPTLPWLVPNTNHAPLGLHPPYRRWLIGYGSVDPWIMSGSALNNDNGKGCVDLRLVWWLLIFWYCE